MEQKRIEALLKKQIQPIYAFARKKTRNLDDAEELAARITAAVHSSLLRHEEPWNLEAWVWRIAQNQWANWLRGCYREKERQNESFDESIHGKSPYPCPQAELEQKELAGLLRREIAWLSSVQRKVVIRHYFENQSVRKMARDLKIPEGTVKWHLCEARQELKKGMEHMRTVGELGIKPVKWYDFYINGLPGKRSIKEFFYKTLNCNILTATLYQDRCIEEIGNELGVSPVFLEDIVSELTEWGFLEERPGKRFRCKVLLKVYTPELVENLTLLYKKYAPLIARDWFPALKEQVKHIKELDICFPRNDQNFLLWSMATWGMYYLFFEEPPEGLDSKNFMIERPDGGCYIAKPSMRNPWFDDIPGSCQDKKYKMNGDMLQDGEKWHSWRMDSRRWDGRPWEVWEEMQQDHEVMVRYLNGKLSPEYNQDEILRLMESGLLLQNGKEKDPGIIVIRGAGSGETSQKLIPAGTPDCRKHIRNFRNDYMKLVLPGFPKHMQETAKADYWNDFQRMKAYILEWLVEEGHLQEVPEELRPGLNRIIWLD